MVSQGSHSCNRDRFLRSLFACALLLNNVFSSSVLQQVDKCFVATQLVAAQAMKCGLTAKQLSCFGLPIRPAFSGASRPKAEVRAQLGMDVDARTVMIVGGGEGMGKLEATAEALAKTLSPSDQIVVICGRNEKLAQKLAARKWPVKVVVKVQFLERNQQTLSMGAINSYLERVPLQGFVTNMADFMSACDCVISKAGPGTIAEALICGMPILLNGASRVFFPGT